MGRDFPYYHKPDIIEEGSGATTNAYGSGTDTTLRWPSWPRKVIIEISETGGTNIMTYKVEADSVVGFTNPDLLRPETMIKNDTNRMYISDPWIYVRVRVKSTDTDLAAAYAVKFIGV